MLDAQPSSNVTVTAARTSGGDTDLSISGSPLTFTDTNWNTAQTLTVSAAEDADATNGSATFEHSASSGDSSYDGASVTISELVANEVDNDTPGVTVTGSPLGVNGEQFQHLHLGAGCPAQQQRDRHCCQDERRGYRPEHLGQSVDLQQYQLEYGADVDGECRRGW